MSATSSGLTQRRHPMKRVEARILEALIRVRQFGLTHAAAFPEGSRGRELFGVVGDAIEEMEGRSATQAQHAHAAKEKTVQKKTADGALREMLRAMARTARAMAAKTPGLAEKFRLPRNAGGQMWLAGARAFAAEAEPLKDEFVRRGMAADFLEVLK